MQNVNIGRIRLLLGRSFVEGVLLPIWTTGMCMVLVRDLSIGRISYCESNGERYGKIEKDIDLWR